MGRAPRQHTRPRLNSRTHRDTPSPERRCRPATWSRAAGVIAVSRPDGSAGSSRAQEDEASHSSPERLPTPSGASGERSLQQATTRAARLIGVVCDRRPVLGVVLGPPLGLGERGLDSELVEAFVTCAIGSARLDGPRRERGPSVVRARASPTARRRSYGPRFLVDVARNRRRARRRSRPRAG